MQNQLIHVKDLFYARLQIFLDHNLDNKDLRAETFVHALVMSKSTLNRKLKESGKPAINKLIKEYRLQKALIILNAGYKVRETSQRVGFKSPSYFTQCFKAYYHQTPAEWVKKIV